MHLLALSERRRVRGRGQQVLLQLCKRLHRLDNMNVFHLQFYQLISSSDSLAYYTQVGRTCEPDTSLHVCRISM